MQTKQPGVAAGGSCRGGCGGFAEPAAMAETAPAVPAVAVAVVCGGKSGGKNSNS